MVELYCGLCVVCVLMCYGVFCFGVWSGVVLWDEMF
jgi:hypothetical protein